MTALEGLQLAGFVVAAFTMGSIPFALLLGKARGVDIRTVGSKNVGATNLGRALGFRWFLAAFALDAVKGLIPTLAYGLVNDLAGLQALSLPAAQAAGWIAVMIAPVLGHMFSPWVGFKGGKGVATGLGALLGVFPVLTVPGVASLAVFLAVLGVWRYVGLASVWAAASLPFWVWQFFRVSAWAFADDPINPNDPTARREPLEIEPWVFIWATAALAGVVIWKHRGNLARVLDGTEPKVGAGRAGSAGAAAP